MQMKISVVICTYRRLGSLLSALESLFVQTDVSSINIEVIIVNNDELSSDIYEVISEFFNKKAPSNFRLVYIHEKKTGLSQARNSGVAASTGSHVIFIDDDCIAKPDYLRKYIDGFVTYNEGVIFAGSIDLPTSYKEQISWLPKSLHWVYGFQILEGTTPRIMSKRDSIFGGNFAVKREVFDAIGMFKLDYGHSGLNLGGGEENDFFMRIVSHYSKDQFIACPLALVVHQFDKTRLTKEYVLKRLNAVGKYRAKLLRDGNKYYSYYIRLVYSYLITNINKNNIYKCAQAEGFISYSKRQHGL